MSILKLIYLSAAQHAVITRGRLSGKMDVEGYRAGSFWI